MRISFRLLRALVVVFFSSLASGQSGNVRVQSVDVGENKATIVIVNDSAKDVTHYRVSIEDISQSGTKGHSAYEEEFGPTPPPPLTWFKPGQTVERVEYFNTAGSDPTASVNAQVVLAIYSDGTAQAYGVEGEEALIKEIERRKSVQLAYQWSVQQLETVLADTSEQHPAAKAAAATREYLRQASLNKSNHRIPALNNAGKPDPAVLYDLPTMLAVPAGGDERKQAERVLADRKQKAAEYAPHTKVRRIP
jgi:hypothetical protein